MIDLHFLDAGRLFVSRLVATLIGVLGATPLVGAELPDSPRVAIVRQLGDQFQPNTVGITGQDGATSVTLPEGGAIWTFGDTVEGKFESIRGLDLADKLSNTAALVPAQDASTGVRRFEFFAAGDRPREMIPLAKDEDRSTLRLWPMHGQCVGDEVFVFYHRIALLPGVDVFENFRLDGMGIARAKLGEWRFKRLETVEGSREFWTGDEPTFGVFTTAHDGYVHLWGNLMTGMFLARTRAAQLTEPASYEYLVATPTLAAPDVKPRWAGSFEGTAPLFDSVPNEMSAAWNQHLGLFVAVHAYLREPQIVLRTAPALTGPWSEPEVIARPERIGKDDLIYAAKEHPELARDGGRVIYVTYVNSAKYVPQLLEVTFK
jgi:hypothetical protein